VKPATKAVYLPLIDMNPAHPDSMLTAMTKAQRLMKECGQNITILTNDQQLYRLAISVNMLVKKHHNSPVGSEPDKTCLHHDGLYMGGTRGKLATPPLGSRANNAILFCVAPPGVFEMIKCGCARDTPCSTAMCGCYTAILPCTMFCGCHGEAHCRNEHTRRVDDSDNVVESELCED